MDLSTFSSQLERDPSGIWRPIAKNRDATISFPENGHASCFEIENDSFWFLHRNEAISLALARYRFEGPFLDVGGGNGAVSRRLQTDGITTVVLEPGQEGASNARTTGLDNVVCATLEQAAFEPGSFGGAGLFDVIEHVEDDVGLLDAVRDVLRPGGVLAVTVPAYEWLWSAEDELAGHHRRYTLRQLRHVLETSGFAVRYETYFFAPLTVPLFFARSLRYRLSSKRTAAAEIETNAAAQHTPGGASRKAMEAMLAPELTRIAKGATIPFGTSCLAIATVA